MRSQSIYLLVAAVGLAAAAATACSGSESASTTTRLLDVQVAENDEEVRAAVESFVGQSLDEFTENVSALGYTVLEVTGDQGGIGSYQSNRLRVATDAGVVVEIVAVG